MKKTLKKSALFLSAALLFAVLLCFSASAAEIGETFTEGFYTYEITELYENASQADARGEVAIKAVDTDIDFFQEIPAFVNGYKATEIDTNAFYDCYNLYGVTVPDTVERIGSYAFARCKNLSKIELPDTITYIGSGAFSGTEYMETQKEDCVYIGKYFIKFNGDAVKTETVEIKEGTILLAEEAFEAYSLYGYDGVVLKNLVLPSSLRYDCGQGTYFYFENIHVNSIEDYLKIDQADGIQAILNNGRNLVVNSAVVTDIVVPGSITHISDSAFRGYEKLKSLTISGSVKEIGNGAFADCINLEKVVLNEGVEAIGIYAFDGCEKLSEITVPKSLKSSDSSAFMMCKQLKRVNISDVGAWVNIDFALSERQFDYDASSNPLCYDADLYLNGKIVKELVIPKGTTIIKESAFAGCNSITKAVIPEGVTEIGFGAFCYTKNLEEIVWPTTINKVYAEAFYYSAADRVYISDLSSWVNVEYCEGKYTDYLDNLYTANPADHLYLNGVEIENLVIPEGITKIRKVAFAYCDSIKTVIMSESVKEIEYSAFRGCDNLEAILFPKSIEKIGKKAFLSRGDLKIYYRGNIPEWDLVHVADNSGIEKPDIINYEYDHIHQYTEKITEPTYKEEGKTEYSCKLCDYSYSEVMERLELEAVSGLKAKKTTESSITLSWKKVTGAESYNVYYSTNGKKWKTVKATKNSVTVKKLTSGKNYQFKVNAVAGEYEGSASSTVKTATKVSKPTVKSVKSSKAKTAVVTWKQVSGASGYVVEYSTSKKFTKKTTKTVKIKKGKTTKTTLKKLKSGKKYYVRIKAYKTVNKKAVYGSYSKVKTVKIK